jgi:hypothetical protein
MSGGELMKAGFYRQSEEELLDGKKHEVSPGNTF